MYGNFFSIRHLREAGLTLRFYDEDFDLLDDQPSPMPPLPYPKSTLPARVDYDIPTYIRRGIKLSPLPPRR
ncbi:hypothetical protein [Methylomagnum sp.]